MKPGGGAVRAVAASRTRLLDRLGPRRVLAVLALLAGSSLTACPGDDGVTPDARDASDGAGLAITWESRPDTIPGDASSNDTIDSAVFRLENIRVVGDAGPIAVGALTVQWAAGIVPGPVAVDQAPPGLYSRLLFDLAPGPAGFAYEITGTVEVDGASRPFTIRDRAARPISLDYSITLRPGGEATIPVRVESDRLAKAVDFEELPFINGRYLVEDDATLAAVRAELASSLGVHP
ncbi:MAG: hypothetical protein M3680_01340 [Myxococcota bacterium]|nr:hypothetical protein [Myxococcota bacterium]